MDSGLLFFDPSCQRSMMFMGNSDPLFRVGGGRTVMNMEETSSKRRPFFSSPDDLYDDDYYDEQSPEKKRRLTPDQVVMLEKSFEVENKLEPERKSELAKKLGLQPRQVAVWFQNRRARWKTKQLERDYDLLKSSYDSLLSRFDSIRNDNDNLRAQIASLTEKLQAKEVAGDHQPIVGQNLQTLPEEVPQDSYVHYTNVKAEDRLSTGSAVVDEDGPQLLDSGDSFFQTDDDYSKCIVPGVDGVHSSSEDGSEDGQSNYLQVFVPSKQHQDRDEEGDGLGWWVWS